MRYAIVSRRGLTLRLTIIAAALALIGHADSGKTLAATVTVNVGDNWFCDYHLPARSAPGALTPAIR